MWKMPQNIENTGTDRKLLKMLNLPQNIENGRSPLPSYVQHSHLLQQGIFLKNLFHFLIQCWVFFYFIPWKLFTMPSCVIWAFSVTRLKQVYGRQGLDWIVGPGNSFGVFSMSCLAPSAALSSVDDRRPVVMIFRYRQTLFWDSRTC